MDIVLSIAGIGVGCFLLMIPYRAVFYARKHALDITIKQFIGMGIRRISPIELAKGLHYAKDQGIDDADAIGVEVHMLCGGSVKNLVDELRKGRQAGISIPFEDASRLYLRGELADEIEKRTVQSGHVQKVEL